MQVKSAENSFIFRQRKDAARCSGIWDVMREYTVIGATRKRNEPGEACFSQELMPFLSMRSGLLILLVGCYTSKTSLLGTRAAVGIKCDDKRP